MQPTVNQLAAGLAEQRGRKMPPVGLWNPPFSGTMDMRIARDGRWYYRGTPINRPAMVKLFSSVLRRDGDEFFLVTPVEKLGIVVDDAPFVAVELFVDGSGENQTLTFRNHVDDTVTADRAHPIRVETNPVTAEPAPYVLVRDRLEALIARPVFYQMVDLGVERQRDGFTEFGVFSAGCFFVIGVL